MKTKLLIFGGLITFLTTCVGCKTHVPMVQNEPATYQRKANAVAHWENMAAEISKGIANQQSQFGNAIYLHPLPSDATEFDLAYWKMLRVHLVNSSWKVVPTPQAANLQLSFESQLVAHGRRDFCLNPTTLWGAIGYGIKHSFTGDSTAAEWSTRKDLLVTALLSSIDGVPVVGATQIVYVPSGDAPLYSTPRVEPHDPFGGDWTAAEHNALSMR